MKPTTNNNNNNNHPNSSVPNEFRSIQLKSSSGTVNTGTTRHAYAKADTPPMAVDQGSAVVDSNINKTYSIRSDVTSPNTVMEEWKNNPTLTPIPAYYPIGPTHRYFPRADLKIVMDRLLKIFQFFSFQTTFHVFPNLSASCISLEHVELIINLWDDTNQVIFEIQRVAGETVPYSGYARKILHAIAEEDVEEQHTISFRCIDERAEAMLRRLPIPKRNDDEDAEQALELTLNVLLSDRRDARSLGLQSLVILTDPYKTIRPIAEIIAKAMLLGTFKTANGIVLTDSRIQKQIFSLSLRGHWADTPADEIELEEQDKPDALLALTAMANAISLLKTQTEFINFLRASSRFFSCSSLVQLMQSRICHAQTEPHEAYLATRILSVLCLAQPDAVGKCIEPDVVRAAQYVGHLTHAALEMESGRLLHALQIAA